MERTVEPAGETSHTPVRGAQITSVLLDRMIDVADETDAAAIFVSGEALAGPVPRALRESHHLIYVVAGMQDDAERYGCTEEQLLRVPDVPLTRMSQVKIAGFLALSRNLIKMGEVIVFLAGPWGSGTLDTLFVMEVGHESELFAVIGDGGWIPEGLRPEVVARVVDIATEIASEGREGKPVGALFVLGDSERVLKLSKQLVLNPFRGYHEDERKILDPKIEETVKEFSSIDGAFVIRGDGVLEACGVFLKTSSGSDNLPHGLGTRHHVAAGITAVTDSIAVTVSESTGTVTIFRDGKLVTEILKSRKHGRRARASHETDN